MAIRLLHLSDIHFQNYKGNEVFDLNNDLRTELERDLQRIVAKDGPINSILIGGDVAFSATEPEYLVADEWIKKISETSKCPVEYVLPIPGNHDVDWKKISPALKDIQQKFKAIETRQKIDADLEKYLNDDLFGPMMLTPLGAYENFAQKYASSPSGMHSLFWETRLQEGALVLKIRGVNSAIFSNSTDNEKDSKLIIGTSQCTIAKEDGVINVILCHHPPSWLVDGDQIQSDLCQRANLLLFGHVHTFGLKRVGETLILAAGAVHPARNEENWEPTYNIIEVALHGRSEHDQLSVKVWRRVWNRQKMRFISGNSDNNDEPESHILNIKEPDVSTSRDADKSAGNLIIEFMTEPTETLKINEPDRVRTLAYRFMSLPYHVRFQLASILGLAEDADVELTESQKNKAYFQRVMAKGIFKELWDQINEKMGQNIPNPF